MTLDPLQQERDSVLVNASSTQPESVGQDVRAFLRVLRVRWRVVLATTIVVAVLTALALESQTPRYTARSVVILDVRSNAVTDASAVLSDLPRDQTTVQNQVQILKSRRLAATVIDKLGLTNDPELQPASRSATAWSRALELAHPHRWFGGAAETLMPLPEQQVREHQLTAFLDHLRATPIPLTTAIAVEYVSASPEKAARIANAVADEYVKDQLLAKYEATQKTTQWLSERIEQLAEQVRTAEAAVQEYKARNNINRTTDGNSVVSQQLTSINAQLVLARAELAQKRAVYDRVRTQHGAGRAADVSQVAASPLIMQLRGQETDLVRSEAELLSRYGPRHPEIVKLQSERANLESKIADEVRRIVKSIAHDVEVSQANVRSLEQSLASAEARFAEQSRSEVQLKSLESAAATTRAQYEAFLSRLKQTQDQDSVQTSDARVISEAAVPVAPSYPRKGLAMAAMLVAGLLFGVIFAILADRLDPGFRRSEDMEAQLGLPMFATVPEVGKGLIGSQKKVLRYSLDHPLSSFAEAMRGIQLSLRLSNIDCEPRIIAVTSAVPGEGKTTIVANLARVVAAGGKSVVVIDADLRKPVLSTAMGLSEMQYGLIDVLVGARQLDECLVKDPHSDVYVLPCRKGIRKPGEVLGSKAMEKLLTELKHRFDYVFVDTAPILPVNDTRIMARSMEAFLLAVRWEKTPREAVLAAVRGLAAARGPIAGTTLTRANMPRFLSYNYSYRGYGAYKSYYSS